MANLDEVTVNLDLCYRGLCPECGSMILEGTCMGSPATLIGWSNKRGSCSVHGDYEMLVPFEPPIVMLKGFVPGETQSGEITIQWDTLNLLGMSNKELAS